MKPTRPTRCLALAALLATGLGGLGCQSGPEPVPMATARPVASISHVVFVSLADPWESKSLVADAWRSLSTIPGVASFSAGPHLDTGRDTVLKDYDVGMVIGFESEKDLARYVDHPSHVSFVERWKPRITALRVYDIKDESR